MTQYYTREPFEKKKEMYLKAIADTQPGVRYLIIHCGYNNEELQAITPSSELRQRPPRIHRSGSDRRGEEVGGGDHRLATDAGDAKSEAASPLAPMAYSFR